MSILNLIDTTDNLSIEKTNLLPELNVFCFSKKKPLR